MTAAAPVSIETPIDWQRPDYAPIFRERIARLERLRAAPEILSSLKEFYKTHPVEFVTDWGCTYDPRNVEIGLPALVPFVLFPRQREYLLWMLQRWQSREDGLVEKSRDMGVSWLCISFAVWLWLYYPGVAVGFGSRKEMYVDDLSNPSSLFWKARKFIECLPAEFRPAEWDEKKCAPYMKLINPENASVIVGEAGDNIGRGARASLYIVDEAAFIEHQESVDASLSQTANCKLDVSTPNGAGNAFYRKRKGGKVNVFVFDWHDDPRKGQDWYEKQAAKLDPVVVAAEIDRNYEGSVANAFIPGAIVLAAMQRGPADVRGTGGLRVGVDVARFGDDKTSIVFRRGRVLLKVVRASKLDVVEVASRVHLEIQAFRETPEQIAVDTIGIGAGVADILRGYYPGARSIHPGLARSYVQQGSTSIVVDVNAALRMGNGQHYNLRAFMWSEMREWLKGASIPNDPDLHVDLTALRYEFRGGELLLEAKDEAKKRGVKSPDDGDAIALTFAVPTIPVAPPLRVPTYEPFDAGMGALG